MSYYEIKTHNPNQNYTQKPLNNIDILSYRNLIIEFSNNSTFQYAINVLESCTLSNPIEIQIDKKQASTAFYEHIQKHYKTFLKRCIEYMYIYGFVPYVITKDKNNNKYPCVLPHGSFTWQSTLNDIHNKDIDYTGSTLCRYDVKIDNITKQKTKTIYVYEIKAPKHNGYIKSPLHDAIIIHKYFTESLHRANEMDCWNTHAHIVTAYKPTPMATAVDPDRALMDFVNPELANLLAPPNHTARHEIIKEHIEKSENNHLPNIYTLPVDHSMDQLRPLQHTDMTTTYNNYLKSSIASTLHIPAFIMDYTVSSNRHFDASTSKIQGSSSTTKTTCRTFFIELQNICHTLESIAQHAYSKCYNTDTVESKFTLRPEHWIQIESIDDIVKLHQAGLTEDGEFTTINKELVKRVMHTTGITDNSIFKKAKT
jgi:hypothetical protein